MAVGRNLIIGLVALVLLALFGPMGFLIWANSKDRQLKHYFDSVIEADGPAAKILRVQAPSRLEVEAKLGRPSEVRSRQTGVNEEIVWAAGPGRSLTASFSAGRLRLMCYNGWSSKECVGALRDDYRTGVSVRIP